MPFPAAERVIFQKNPLKEVVCQLMFPPILKIDAEIPAGFQEKIRDEFPNYIEGPSARVTGPPAIQGVIPLPIQRQLDILKMVAESTAEKIYEFYSEDEDWKLTLSRTFIALTTKKYKRWEKFYEKLKKPLVALTNIYAPAYYNRVGLRYKNIISRSDIGLDKSSWTELLKPFILCLLATPEIRDSVQNYTCVNEISLDDKESIVRLIIKRVEKEDNREECLMLDSDFIITKRVEIDAVAEKLKYFNIQAACLMQWCISKKLYEALDPKVI